MPDLFEVSYHIRCYDFAHLGDFYLEGEVDNLFAYLTEAYA
jgi:hypothetical protein